MVSWPIIWYQSIRHDIMNYHTILTIYMQIQPHSPETKQHAAIQAFESRNACWNPELDCVQYVFERMIWSCKRNIFYYLAHVTPGMKHMKLNVWNYYEWTQTNRTEGAVALMHSQSKDLLSERTPSGISSNLNAMKWLSRKYAAQGEVRGAQHMNYMKGTELALALSC